MDFLDQDARLSNCRDQVHATPAGNTKACHPARVGLLATFFGVALLSITTIAQVHAQGVSAQKLTASLRMGLSYIDDQTNAGDYGIADFGSRLSWQGQTQLAQGLAANGYIELGLDSDNNTSGASGIDHTRQMWAGLSGGWGSLGIGTQYGSFYDIVSAHTNIASWGSCWTQLECARKTQVLKYQSAPGPLVLAMSLTANQNDDGNDINDQIEYGFNYRTDALLLGIAGATYADEGNATGGSALGGIIKANLATWSIAIGYQKVDQSVATASGVNPGAATDVTNLTLALTFGGSYLVYNKGDTGNAEPDYITVGYNQVLAKSTSLQYEYQQVNNDDGGDADVYARAFFRYDW